MKPVPTCTCDDHRMNPHSVRTVERAEEANPVGDQATGCNWGVLSRPLTEVDLVVQILGHVRDLEATFGEINGTGMEIRTHGRSRADILLLADDLVAVEAKLTHWKRAVGQAVLNTTVVDRSYVAMWGGQLPHGLVNAAREYNLGLIAVHQDGLEEVVRAEPGCPDPTARAWVLQRLAQDIADHEDRGER